MSLTIFAIPYYEWQNTLFELNKVTSYIDVLLTGLTEVKQDCVSTVMHMTSKLILKNGVDVSIRRKVLSIWDK